MSPLQRRQRRFHAAREQGQAGAEILFFAFLIIVPMVLVAVNAWAVVDTKFMATAAAREAARTYVESPSADVAWRRANAAIDDTILRSGGHLDRLILRRVDGVFERCGRVEVTIRYRIPAVRVPPFGAALGTREVTARHSEVVDAFRSGLAGEVRGACLEL